eukprot:2385713-Rhodomonas_salina.1
MTNTPGSTLHNVTCTSKGTLAPRDNVTRLSGGTWAGAVQSAFLLRGHALGAFKTEFSANTRLVARYARSVPGLSLIHISEPTRPRLI